VSAPTLVVVAVLTDGQKQLLSLELCSGGETLEAWKSCLDDSMDRRLATPVWRVIDGHPGLRKAVGLVWPRAPVQRCCLHKLRNLEGTSSVPSGAPPLRAEPVREQDAPGARASA